MEVKSPSKISNAEQTMLELTEGSRGNISDEWRDEG